MISGMMNVSKGNRYCYPYLEAIESFLPVVDEMVVVLDPYSHDGTREDIEKKFPDVRIVSAPFNLQKWGRISWGIQKTTGYHACRGDIIVMFDADGLLHEKDIDETKQKLKEFANDPKYLCALWRKYRFFTPHKYYFQSRHYGIFNKKKLGDRFDFFDATKGAANFKPFTDNPTEIRRLIGIELFGYEHIWDTEEIFTEKIWNYGLMLDKAEKKNRTLEDFRNRHMAQIKERLAHKDSGEMRISDHPIYIKEKLRSVGPQHFGYEFFKYAQ